MRYLFSNSSVWLTSPNLTLAQGQGGSWDMMHNWGGGLGMLFGPLYMIVLLAILVGVVVLVIRWMGSGGPSLHGTSSTARAILDERFARGEIDHEEYEKRRRALES